jgi:drug/metabolite transporter (DMT)-like permease
MLPSANAEQWLWLGLSGIIGLGIGDLALLVAFVMIGTRRSLLIMVLSPIFTIVGAYFLLEETLSTVAIIGIAVSLAGITIVLFEKDKNSSEESLSNTVKKWGIFFAIIGALGQGIGIMFAKKGIRLNPDIIMHPVSATLIRTLLGVFFIWMCAIAIGKIPELQSALKCRIGMKYTATGAFIAPFLGVSLSMVAVTFTKTGIAQTLMSLMPIMIIPVLWIFYRQKTSLLGIGGAMIAVFGVAILFLF